MARFYKAKTRVIKFNARQFSEALKDEIEVQIRQAAREWLRAALLKVPVYTGMARGSFLPLASYLNRSVPINPIAKRRYGDPASGAALSDYKFYWRSQTYTFMFDQQVPHYLINEINVGLGSPPLRHPTPWRSLDAGRTAFLDYLDQNLKNKVPRVVDYISITEIYGG